jgi:hypothetical protein
MDDKRHVIGTLKEEFKRWEELLAGMSEEQISAPQLASNWSIKDVIAHLWAWQQRSIARMVAARLNREPEFPHWPAEFDPEAEGQPHQLNAWIYETYRERPWSRVYGDWRAGFLRFLELGEKIPEKDLLEPGRYAWLDGNPLSLVLTASCEHHEEHCGWLLAWLDKHGSIKVAE